MHENLDEQAEQITRYLSGKQANETVKQLYRKAVLKKRTYDSRDQSILKYWNKHPRSLALLDAALAYKYPNAELRRRIYIIFAILESSPDYVSKFLSKKRHILYNVAIAGIGIRAVVKAAAGMALLKRLESKS